MKAKTTGGGHSIKTHIACNSNSIVYTEDAGLPYFDRAVVTANGFW